MSKVIAKINLNWGMLDPNNCTITGAHLPDEWKKSYYVTGMPIGYYLHFTYKED
tara:strand:- start:1896 stop:2057 length:162 start_codon:yes stop_codon:yes gene_type:complete